ncbi:MAG: hypothetical protein QXU45_05925 [Candidatus Bathyarchaeia archaeon]
MEEREITLALRDFLLCKDWQILSIHFPGAQGGLSISVNGKSRGWVPDIIALKDRAILVVECKPKYSNADINKLNIMFKNPKFFKKIKQKLRLSSDFIFQKAIGFHAICFRQEHVPTDFVIFVVKDEATINVLFGKCVDPKIHDIL